MRKKFLLLFSAYNASNFRGLMRFTSKPMSVLNEWCNAFNFRPLEKRLMPFITLNEAMHLSIELKLASFLLPFIAICALAAYMIYTEVRDNRVYRETNKNPSHPNLEGFLGIKPGPQWGLKGISVGMGLIFYIVTPNVKIQTTIAILKALMALFVLLVSARCPGIQICMPIFFTVTPTLPFLVSLTNVPFIRRNQLELMFGICGLGISFSISLVLMAVCAKEGETEERFKNFNKKGRSKEFSEVGTIMNFINYKRINKAIGTFFSLFVAQENGSLNVDKVKLRTIANKYVAKDLAKAILLGCFNALVIGGYILWITDVIHVAYLSYFITAFAVIWFNGLLLLFFFDAAWTYYKRRKTKGKLSKSK